MRRSRAETILLCCFFSLIVWSRHSVFAQETSQAPEKERGIELYRKGDFSEAAEALKEAVKKRQKDSGAWYYLGLSLHRVGEIKDARKAFEKTLSLRPDFAPAYMAMAYMQLFGNDNKGAVRNAEKASALDPKNVESLYIAGVARLRQKRAAEALAKAEDALKINPDYPQALILKTEAHINMFARERDKYSPLKAASESLEAYLKLKPEQPEHAFWSEQLEAIRFYARRADGSGSDKPVASMTGSLRPTILYREKANYTEDARLAGIEGAVILMVVFADEGVLRHILVLQGLSHGLTEQAIAAARKIRFTPAMRDGKPISVNGQLEFYFNLY